MHIVLVSDAVNDGGAAMAASRLAEGLLQAGHRVTRIIHFPDGREYGWKTEVLSISSAWHRYFSRTFLPARWQFSFDSRFIEKQLSALLSKLRPDVISVHNLLAAMKRGWQPSLIGVCADYAPTIWTLHDMWSFTGRCAYSYECRKFENGCDASCPTPDEYPSLQPHLISQQWRLRAKVLASHPEVVAVTPSAWLAGLAKSGLWKNHVVRIIPYGVPTDLFEPVDRHLARRALGIEPEGKLILFVSHDLTNRTKGLSYLQAALDRLPDTQLSVLTIGKGSVCPGSARHRWVNLGYIDYDRAKVLAYSAADVLAHPSLADNLPNVVLESFACGTPVISFSIGGLPELVRPAVTGWMASDVTSDSFADAVLSAFKAIDRGNDLRSSCRQIAEAEYSIQLQARRYQMLFQTLTEK